MKRIFLTGASAGIGLATTEALLAEGHEVWGTSRHPEKFPQRERFHPVGLDLRDMNAIEQVFERYHREAGHFDVVINNAGSGHFGPAELLPAVEISDQVQVLYLAHIRLMQITLTKMRGRDSGLIINVTSLASRLPVPFMAAYNAGKAAMAAFTMSIQLELGKSKVRIVDLQPADINTDFNDSVVKGGEDSLYSQGVRRTWVAVEKNMAAAPRPELVARAIVRLVDSANPPPRITIGDTFQTKVAPLIFRFLPQRVRIWGLKKYYGI